MTNEKDILYLQSTQLTTFYECPRKWWYNFVLRRGKPPSEAMLKGSCFHKLAEYYYGEDHLDLISCIEKVRLENQDLAPSLTAAALAFASYIERWEGHMDIIEIDGKPAIEQEFSLILADDIIIKGKIDYLRQDRSKKYVSDWKVTGMYLSDWYFMGFEMSFQTKLYSYVAKEYFPNVDGFIIDATLSNKAGKIDHKRQFFPILPDGEEFIAEVYRNACFIQEYKNEEDAFEHRWNSCVTKYGRCPYFEVCRTGKKFRERLLATDDYVDTQMIYKEMEK